MVDLTSEMADLWTALGAPSVGATRIIQFVAATTGEGASTVAREFAFFASRRARRGVWLVDLDLLDAPQHRAIGADPGRYGVLGRQSAASPDGSAFFTVQPPMPTLQGPPWPDARFIVAHAVGGARLWVTRFRREALQADQTPHVLPTDGYWQALRHHAELIVVDAPALDQSASALTVAPRMDATAIVVAADAPDAGAAAALKEAIQNAGGRCAGLVFNKARDDAPPFLKRSTR
jgi:Mrp family chromosome partitioning ATPase